MEKRNLKMFALKAILVAMIMTVAISCEKDKKEESLTGIGFDEEEIELLVGDEEDLSDYLVAQPSGMKLPDCTWKSSKSSVAKVDKSTGMVTAQAEGEATITATTADGNYSAKCTIRVAAVSITLTDVVFSQYSFALAAGETTDLSTYLMALPSGAQIPSCNWKSSTPTVATVDTKGVVTAVAAGASFITATTKDGKFSTQCTVVVTKDPIPLTGIKFSQTSFELAKGGELNLLTYLAATPSGAQLPTCTWSSSATGVATVSTTGTVTAVETGSATITAKTSDSKYSATCTITVTGTTPPYTVSGSLENSVTATWSYIDVSLDYEKTYSITAPISNKQFSVDLTTPASLLPWFSTIPSGVSINPTTARFGDAWFYARKGAQRSQLFQIGFTSSDLLYEVQYTYVDRNTTMTGSYIDSDGDKNVFNLQLVQGWNTIILTFDDSGSVDTYTYKTGSAPSDAIWISEADLSSVSAQKMSVQAPANRKSIIDGKKIDREQLRKDIRR